MKAIHQLLELRIWHREVDSRRGAGESRVARVAVRTNTPYGKTTAEAERIVANLEEVEPLLRRIVTNEIDATQSPEIILDAVVSATDTAQSLGEFPPALFTSC